MAVLKIGDLILPVSDYDQQACHIQGTISHTHHTDRPHPEQTGGSPLKVKLAVEQLSNLATGRTFRTRVRSVTAIVVLPIHHHSFPYRRLLATRLGDYG